MRFVFIFFNIGKTTGNIFYDYIRTVKPPAIRYIKTISLFVAAGFIITSIIVVTHPSKKTNTITPANSGSSYDKKIQVDKAKKNSIMRRFISYYDVNSIPH